MIDEKYKSENTLSHEVTTSLQQHKNSKPNQTKSNQTKSNQTEANRTEQNQNKSIQTDRDRYRSNG
jgi:hypothetical protein